MTSVCLREDCHPFEALRLVRTRTAGPCQSAPILVISMAAQRTFLSGSFSFTSDDFELDMSNAAASYPLAEAVFEGMEDRHDSAAVHAWMSEMTSAAGQLDETTLSTSLARHFDERPSDLLALRPRARP